MFVAEDLVVTKWGDPMRSLNMDEEEFERLEIEALE